MARALTDTLLSLDQWAQVLGLNPWEFNQIGKGLPKNNTQQCGSVFYQYNYQQDFLSREQVATAIADAENAIAEQLGYYPAPKYTVGEQVQYPRPANHQFGGTYNWAGEWKAVELQHGHFIGGGAMARTSLGDTTDLTFSDPDGDGVNELFTCSIPYTTNTNVDEIALYFRATDRNNDPIGETWRIRPINVSIAAGVATITGHASLLVVPNLTLVYNPQNLSAVDTANYVAQVAVYRVWRDDTHTDSYPYQGVAEWDNACECSPNCTFNVRPICLGGRLDRQGMPYASFDLGCSFWDGYIQPNRLNVNYLSGLPLVNGRVSDEWARIIAYLACALLPTEPCGCERSQRVIAHWKEPEKIDINSGAGQRAFSPKEIDNNPFGSIGRGAIYAWKRVAAARLVGAASV